MSDLFLIYLPLYDAIKIKKKQYHRLENHFENWLTSKIIEDLDQCWLQLPIDFTGSMCT